MKPLIGITADLTIGKRDRHECAFLDVGYSDEILRAGGLPVVIPPYVRDEVLEDYLERVDGVLFTGGGDLEPRKLGKRPHPAIKPMLARREESDRMLMQMVIDRKMPCLCVGVSMQLMNIMHGGTIHSHLPEDMPRGLPHFDPIEGSLRHGVFVTPATRLEDLYGEGEIRVNSSHHQGIKTLGKRIRSGALAPDGLIEAIESTDRSWFMIGVQWHPESESASALDRQLFDGFVNACCSAANKNTRSQTIPMAA